MRTNDGQYGVAGQAVRIELGLEGVGADGGDEEVAGERERRREHAGQHQIAEQRVLAQRVEGDRQAGGQHEVRAVAGGQRPRQPGRREPFQPQRRVHAQPRAIETDQRGVDDIRAQHGRQLRERLIKHGDAVERREVAQHRQKAGTARRLARDLVPRLDV